MGGGAIIGGTNPIEKKNQHQSLSQSPSLTLRRTRVLGVWLLSLRCLSLGLREAVDDCSVEHIHTAGWTGLLALEPGLQTGRVEDVRAGELLAARHHLLPTDDAHVVHSLQLLYGSIWIAAGRGRGRTVAQHS